MQDRENILKIRDSRGRMICADCGCELDETQKEGDVATAAHDFSAFGITGSSPMVALCCECYQKNLKKAVANHN